MSESSGRNALAQRTSDSLAERQVPGSEDALGPFFSPDGEWIGLLDLAGTAILKLPTAGGPTETVVENPDQVAGATWGENDLIVYGTESSGLYGVPASGGVPQALTDSQSEGPMSGHRWPSFVAGRNAVVFSMADDAEEWFSGARLAVLDLESNTTTMLGLVGFSPQYAVNRTFGVCHRRWRTQGRSIRRRQPGGQGDAHRRRSRWSKTGSTSWPPECHSSRVGLEARGPVSGIVSQFDDHGERPCRRKGRLRPANIANRGAARTVMAEHSMSRGLAWSFWIPLASLVAVEIYASGFDGWGAWATAPLFLIPLILSVVLAVVGAVQCVREHRAGAGRRSTVILTLLAVFPLFWLLVRRHIV